MNRRGFFGTLVGGVAAATGLRALAGSRVGSWRTIRAEHPVSAFGLDLQVLSLDAPVAPSELDHWARSNWSRPPVAPQLVQGHAGDLDALEEALPHHGVIGEVPVMHGVELMLGSLDDARGDAGSVQHHADDHLQSQDLPAEKGSLLDRFVTHSLPPGCSASVNAPKGAGCVHDGADLPEVWPGHLGTISATASLPPFDQIDTLIELVGKSGEAAPSFAAALIGELVLTRFRLDDLRRIHAPAGLAS